MKMKKKKEKKNKKQKNRRWERKAGSKKEDNIIWVEPKKSNSENSPVALSSNNENSTSNWLDFKRLRNKEAELYFYAEDYSRPQDRRKQSFRVELYRDEPREQEEHPDRPNEGTFCQRQMKQRYTVNKDKMGQSHQPAPGSHTRQPHQAATHKS